jgi:hypothetical protein
MNAELFLFGKRIDMARRSRRRLLVVLVYAGLTALLTVMWSFNHQHGVFLWIAIAPIFVNRFLLGGGAPGGLVKPFHCGENYSYKSESSLDDLLRWGFHRSPNIAKDTFRNDERELRQRDGAHFRASRIISVAFGVLILAMYDRIEMRDLFPSLPIPSDMTLYGLAMITWVLFETLPQCILLWTEPDMEAEG